ncbi:MAG: hypothetical protein E7460_00175 [Ruminococcaceae bacterium]|nr:hypothetical protein [Oscillospiraceae bacterium]
MRKRVDNPRIIIEKVILDERVKRLSFCCGGSLYDVVFVRLRRSAPGEHEPDGNRDFRTGDGSAYVGDHSGNFIRSSRFFGTPGIYGGFGRLWLSFFTGRSQAYGNG